MKIGIIGDGRMGVDIFNHLVKYDLSVFLVCRDSQSAEKQKSRFIKRITRQVDNELMSSTRYDRIVSQTRILSDIDELADRDLVIEAVDENLDIKIQLFKKLAGITGKTCILATNSSSIIPSRLIPAIERKSSMVGIHFFYPLQFKDFVEVIYTDETSSAVKDTVERLIAQIEKYHLILHEDNAFILNRIFLDFQALAFYYKNRYSLSVDMLDAIITGSIFPIGVFRFFDAVGIDVMLPAIRAYASYNDDDRDLYRPMIKELDDMVRNKMLGVKNKQGFYTYPDKSENEKMENRSVISNEDKNNIALSLKAAYINSVCKIIEKKISTRQFLDMAVKEYMDTDTGPSELIEETGRNVLADILLKLHDETGFMTFYPSKLLMGEKEDL